MKSKASEQFKEASLYNVIATCRITNKTSIFERNLTYEDVANLDAEGYAKSHKRYRDFRLQRVEIPPAKVVKSEGRTVFYAKCEQCGAEFKGTNCSNQAQKHVAVYRHKVTMTKYLITDFSPENPGASR